MGYSAGPLDVSNYDWFWDTYNPSVDYTPIVNDINNMGLGSDGQMMPEESGFLMDFDELNGMFGLVDLDLMTDGFSAADRDFLTSMGLDGYEMVNRAFTDIDVGGGNLMAVNELLDQGIALTNQMIADANASFARNKIIADIQASDIAKLEAAAEEFYYQTQKRNSDSASNQISKFRGFLTSQYELDPETGQMVGVGTYHDKEAVGQAALDSAAYDLEQAVYDFMASPGYDNRFHEVDTRQQILSDDGETMIDNPNYMQSEPSQGLIDDYVYAPYMPDEDAQTIVERDLLNIPGFTGEGEILDSGERNTATGKLIAVALDLAGLGDIGTKLYLTQSTWNMAVNAVERGINKILGTGIDLPNINLHEFAATLLNEKFVDKDGEPILEGIANKAEWLIPFYDPTLSVNLAALGGNELGKFDPTGENIFENIADALLEGPILDAVQEASDAGKFKDIETDRGQGIMGFLGNMKAFVQSGGVAIQKVLGPGLSQAIVNSVFFEGLPGAQILNSIGVALGPQSLEDWKRYLEDKGIDPNNVEEKDISYYRALVDEYLTDPTTKPSGLTSLQEVTNGIDDGGVGARYLNTMNNWFRDTYGVNLDTIDPIDAAALMLNTIEDQRKYEQDAYMSPAQLQTAYDNENILRSIQGLESISFEQFKADYEASVQSDVFKVDIGNGFSFDAETVKNITDEIEIGDFQSSEDKSNRLLEHANYILSDGNQGESLQNFYNSDIQLTSEAAMASTRTVGDNVVVLPDVEVTGYQFQYVTAPNGSDAAYDPLTGVTYALQEDRLINNPGVKDDRYDFPSLTYSDLLTSDKNLNPKRLKEIAKQGRIEYGELKKYVEENPYVYLGKSKETHRQDIVRGMIGSNYGWNGRVSVYTLADLSAEGVEDFYSKYNINPSTLSSVTGRDSELPFDYDNMPQHTFTGDELRKLGVDIFSEDALNIAGYMHYKGRKPNNGPQYYEFQSASPITLEEYNNPAPKALRAFESELGNYYLRKYTGDNTELIEEIESNAMYYDFLNSIDNNVDWSEYGYYDLEGHMIKEGLVDADLGVSIGNTTYLEDFQVESDYKPSDYSLFTAPVSVPGQPDQTMLFVEDLETGIVEFYDNDRMNLSTGKYEFDAPTVSGLENVRVRIPGTNNFSVGNRADIGEVLKRLYASGQISADEVTAVDLALFTKEYDSQFTHTVVNTQGGQYSYGMENYVDPDLIYYAGYQGDFATNPETGDFVFMDTYVFDNPSVVGEEEGLGQTGAGSFYNLPDFNVIGFDNFEDLSQGYQDRLDFIDATSFDYNTKDFLKQNAYELYKSREAFLELDEESQSLILQAQAEATSDFTDLGVFTVTANNITDLDAELQTRLNQITAADLSEGQEQYEIDLANAIYNAKKTEINTLFLKNNSINALTQRKAALEAKEEEDEEKILGLEATIEKIRSYEIPEFNVNAYMNAEDPGAYMQNFVNEVRKGTTEEFGNVLSIENADQILLNVAALAQSQEDLDIAEKARDDNYQLYLTEQKKYYDAIIERNDARQQRDANATRITELQADLYVEIDNFEVTATDIQGAQSQLNDFNAEIDRMVSDGEITSEQGDLEKALAVNTFDVYKATQDISALQTSTDTTIAGLRADLKTAQDSAASFEAEADEFESKYNTTKADLEANQSYTLPDFNVWRAMSDMGYVWNEENSVFDNPQGLEYQVVQDEWIANYEQQLIDDGILTQEQITNVLADLRGAIGARQSRAYWKNTTLNTQSELSDAESRIGELQTFSLPEFSITATTLDGLNDYLDEYLTYVNTAEENESISAEQAINFRNIISSLKRNGADIFDLEAANKTKQDEIDNLTATNTGLSATIGEKDEEILDLTGTISVIGSGFDVTLYDDISDLDAGLASYIQGINDSDLDEEMKESQIAFAESMAAMRRENLFVPTYEAPDFNVVAEGDLTGLNQSYAQAMFTLDSFLDNEYITQEEYDSNVADLNTAYNTRKDEIVPTYTLPEFTVSELDAEGGFTNLDAEKEGFLDDLQSFLDNDYITREEYDAFEAQIESAYDTKKRDITPVYEAPDFTVYEQLQPGETFEDIDTAYNTAYDELTLNAQLGYISASDYITQLNDLQTSYEDARKGIAPAYELPDFSVYGQIAEGDDTTEIDTAYQNELTRLEEYKDSGYISLSEYYDFLGQLETEYTTRRKGVLPTYTMPDFSVTPASSLAELAEMEQAALDRFEMFSRSGYFPEDFNILTEQENLQALIDAERARIQGTYTLPEFKVEDTKGLLTQKEIEGLFSEYEEGLRGDVLEGMLGLDDFFNAMEGAKTTFDVEFAKRKPIQPRPGDYAIIPDPINEGDADQPSTGDFLGYVDDGNFPDQYGTIGGIDTSGILTGNYMAKLDPAYQLAEILLGEDRAKQMYPTGKSRGLADEQFQEIVNQFMLGQAEDAFEMQSGLSGKMQDLATEQRRLQRKADLDLMAEFGDPYRQQLEELYPEQAAALKKQREIADIAAERAKGDLSPREQAQVEQQGYLFGATRGRDVDPMTLYRALGEETSIREGRETTATNQLTTLMNMERGLYGDLPGVIGTQSPFIEGVGDIQTPFNIGGIMDLGSVDFANQQKLQEVNMAIQQLDRDYQTAVALQQPSKAQETLVKLNEYKAMADALSSGISTAKQAFGTLGDIVGGIGSGISSIFGGDPYAADRAAFNKYYGASGKGSNNDILDYIMSL